MSDVTFTKDANGNLEVAVGGRVVGWLEDAGVWTWFPDRRQPDITFKDRRFGRDFEGAKRFIIEQVRGLA